LKVSLRRFLYKSNKIVPPIPLRKMINVCISKQHRLPIHSAKED
jgi:hypothetical protein